MWGTQSKKYRKKIPTYLNNKNKAFPYAKALQQAPIKYFKAKSSKVLLGECGLVISKLPVNICKDYGSHRETDIIFGSFKVRYPFDKFNRNVLEKNFSETQF